MKKQRGENNSKKHPRKMKGLIVTGASAVAAGMAVWGWFGSTEPTDGITTAAPWAVAAREKRTPLSPALFVGQTARAYQVAHDIPHILDQLYCYCECDKHLGHPSLLSCFIDSHAAT